MRKVFVGLLLLLGVAATANLALAQTEDFGTTDVQPRLTNAKVPGLASRAAKLRGSAVVTDTTYIGYTPGHFNSANNWWSIYSGYSDANSNTTPAGAFRRPYVPGVGGMWSFETPLHGDSMQGWWSAREIMNGAGGLTLPDWARPWWAIEIGNLANFVQPGSSRTYGVVGVWHRDNGSLGAAMPNPGSLGADGPIAPTWLPIGGSGFSAWMGLRGDGDTAFVDPITRNPFNSRVMQFTATSSVNTNGSDNSFPGYGSQMDQFLYKDIDMSGNPTLPLQVSFDYRLAMSTGFGTAAASRVGWFDKDPLEPTADIDEVENLATGNFISSTDAGNDNAPRDSFTVYIGAPVGSTFLNSKGVTQAVYDPQRRWFSEVIRANEAGLWKQLHGDTGRVALASKSVTIPNSVLAPMLTASGGKVRLVFRVHTNRGFDDQSAAFSSGGAGAAVLDNVSYQIVGGPASPVGWGTFEAANSIDNSTAVDPMNAWKATGKGPQPFAHADVLADMTYDDLCGQPGDVSRICNLDGIVISLGDHDHSEAASGLDLGTADRELWIGAWSPTIQLRGPYPNPIGLLAEGGVGGNGKQDAFASEDMYLDADIYAGVFDPFSKGVLWRAGLVSYPANDRNGNKTWGNPRYLPYIIFNPDQQCFRDIGDHYFYGNSMVKYDPALSQSPNYPDSIKVLFGHRSECYRFGVTSGCAPTDGSYWDNISVAIVDGDPAVMSVSIWDLINDSFPANETAGLPAYAPKFDTTSAYVKVGVNVAPTTGNLNRFTVPGDTVSVIASSPGRVDMIFRILPGPGNYAMLGRADQSPAPGFPAGTLRKLPTSYPSVLPAALTAVGGVANSSNFWESYLFNNGEKGTPGGHAGGVWNPNVWNSARCDTVEGGVFAVRGRLIIGAPTDNAVFRSSYHESELYGTVRSNLAIRRHRCYLASASAVTTDIDCVHNAGTSDGSTYDLTYLTAPPPAPQSGWDPNPGPTGVPPNETVEGTKILPDGQFTPGTHVQYFFRKTDDPNPDGSGGTFAGMMPDTMTVFPQIEEGSTDAHRWQQFSVLPDRWKEATFNHPVLGSRTGVNHACMLVVDNNDRRGDERVWVSVADTIGATAVEKHGAHNGWFAPGTGTPAVNDPANRIARHGGSPGTTWDFYGIKASESLNTATGSLGSRLSYRDPANTQINLKSSRLGPTPEMLDVFYKMIFQFTGDLNSSILGPFLNKSADDVGILKGWLNQGSTSAINVNRGIWAQGDGFVESNHFQGTATGPQQTLNTTYFGVTLRNNSYALESGSGELVPDLLPIPGGPLAGAGVLRNDIWGVQNQCLWTNDVLEQSGSLVVQPSTQYEATGPGPFPYIASIAKAHTAGSPFISNVDGWDMTHLRSRFDTDAKGRHRYFNEVVTNIFSSLCALGGQALIALDVPNLQDGSQFVDFMNLKGNPSYGRSTIDFGLAKADRVELRIFDVAGRLVRTLADRNFAAGPHTLVWDGSDNAGKQVARGVYFTQLRFVNRNITNAKKLTVLK